MTTYLCSRCEGPYEITANRIRHLDTSERPGAQADAQHVPSGGWEAPRSPDSPYRLPGAPCPPEAWTHRLAGLVVRLADERQAGGEVWTLDVDRELSRWMDRQHAILQGLGVHALEVMADPGQIQVWGSYVPTGDEVWIDDDQEEPIPDQDVREYRPCKVDYAVWRFTRDGLTLRWMPHGGSRLDECRTERIDLPLDLLWRAPGDLEVGP